MRKKVILFHLTPRMGMLHYASQFANALTKKVDLKIIIASYYNDSIFDDTTLFYTIRTNPSFSSFIFDTLLFWNHIKLFFFIIRNKPDIIHFIDNHPWYIIYAPLFKYMGIKIYVTQHDPTLHSGENTSIQGKIAILTNKILRNIAEKLIVHGDHLRNELINVYKISTNKIISIPHGNYNFLAKDISKYTVNQSDNFTFLFFGRIVEYKGLDMLFIAYKELQSLYSSIRLLVVGEGDLSPYIAYIDGLEHIDIVNQSIETEDIGRYFVQADCVVLPYRDATGSGIIPLAYAFEKPVITTDVGEFVKIISESSGGIYTSSNDVSGLIQSMTFAIENREKMLQFGKNGRKYTEDILGWDKIINIIYG